VPAFLGTAHAVVQAQQARGLDLQGGNVVVRAGRYVPLMVPLMTHVIRQTLLLAMALEAKGFDPSAARVRADERRFTAADYVVLAGLAVLLLLCLWLRWNGYGVVGGVGF
jgi:energy-coupling factor transporter transmembrane protein EcfT